MSLLVPNVDKNVNYLILEKLNDRELGKVCQTNQAMRELCKNDMFWKKRFITRFSQAIPNYEKMFLKRQEGFSQPDAKTKMSKFKSLFSRRNKKSKVEDYTWRKYYIDIVNWLENYYKEDVMITGDDIVSLADFMTVKTLEYLKCFLSDDNGTKRCGEFKNIDLLEPRVVIAEGDDLNLQDEVIRNRYLRLLSDILDDKHRTFLEV